MLHFHFHQEAFWLLFTFCHKGGGICMSEVLIFLPAILIPACGSSSSVFLMMYSAYKLNKQGDYIQPWCTPFPIWNQSVLCPVLTLAPDLHISFSRGRSGGLVFPSFSEFPTVYCDQLPSGELKDATDLDAGEDSWNSLGQQDQTSFS